MMDERKYKYSNYQFSHHWDGTRRDWPLEWKVINNKVSALRLLRMTVGLKHFEISSGPVVPLEKKTIVNVYAALTSGVYGMNEYMQRVVDVSGLNGLNVSVDSYPSMTYVYPYEHGEWVYPVVFVPGAGISFTIYLYTIDLLSSSVWSFIDVVMIFEDV